MFELIKLYILRNNPHVSVFGWAGKLALFSVSIATVLLASATLPSVSEAAKGRLELIVVDSETKKPIPCRIHLRDAKGRARRSKGMPFWSDHFVFPGKITLNLPTGNYFFELERGPEYVTRHGHFTIKNFADDSKTVDLRRFVDMSAEGWWSGDVDVHRPVRDIKLLIEADDLHVVTLFRLAEKKGGSSSRTTASDILVNFDTNRYFHTMSGLQTGSGGTFAFFNLDTPLSGSESDRAKKSVLETINAARNNTQIWIDATKPFWWDLPMLIAHGQVDSVQIANSHIRRKSVKADEAGGKSRDKRVFPGLRGNARWSQSIYFHLLNCGLRIPPSAGSGSGKSPNPIGYNRMYVHVEGALSYEKWWENFRAGRVTITNGPLLRPTVHGELPGHVFQAEKGSKLELKTGLTLSTREPISYLEIIKNGKVAHSVRLEDYSKTGRLPKIQFDRSGWFLVRAVTDLSKTYRFALTGPYYVEIGYKRRISRKSVRFFLDWADERLKQVKSENSRHGEAIVAEHQSARDFWEELLLKANAE